MNTFRKFDNKKVLIWGYGREGKSSESFIKKHAENAEVEIFEGLYEEIDAEKFDYIIKSPGIPYLEENKKIISQTDIFFENFKDKVIGVTGTKGKSTTAAMLSQVLQKASSKKVFLLGNIGKPCLDYFDDIDDNSIIVFELSCHQLAHATMSPHIAVLLNIFEEHLDYYKTLERYRQAKLNVTNNQTNKDYLVVGEGCSDVQTKAQKIVVTSELCDDIKLTVVGKNNYFNAKVVRTIATQLVGCKDKDVLNALEEFKGLPHRLEYVTERNGIKFYDDSISTIPEAAINAMESISGKKIALIGGMDRGIDYSILIDYIKEHREITFICMYATGQKIYNAASTENVIWAEDLENAVNTAYEVGCEKCSCILTPAAPSYDHFKNFEERGELFKKYILK